MKVIICGAGQVGLGIAERLSTEGNDVTVIDSQAALVQRANETLDVRAIHGNGAHPDVLARASAADADMLIAVTLYDEVNMVACQVADLEFNIPTKIARVRAQSYTSVDYPSLFGHGGMKIDYLISPEREVGEAVLRRLEQPGAFEMFSFIDGQMTTLGIACAADCPVLDTTLSQLADLFPDLPASIVAIVRNGQLSVAHASERLRVGDDVYITVPTTDIARTLRIFGHVENQARRIIIAGGGNIGYYVAKQLEERAGGVRARIIEGSRERAMFLAQDLRETPVLHGSSLSEQLLREADVATAETIVALTNDDQVNILTSVLAKQLGCQRSICLWNSSGYATMIRSLAIDAQVNPRAITTSRILQFVRRGRIRGVHAVQSGRGELIEGDALETSPLVGRPISELKLGNGLRIAGVWRHTKPVQVRGDTELKPKDRVIIFAMADRVHDAEQMFRVAPDYFN
ncbi:MAG: Trk system potassium transporter TrkA [Hyphomicrobiaceae bacterium]